MVFEYKLYRIAKKGTFWLSNTVYLKANLLKYICVFRSRVMFSDCYIVLSGIRKMLLPPSISVPQIAK